MKARVSVIVPVYNGEAFVRDAVESALAQTQLPFEIVVCDDGSTDETPRIARSLPVVYMRQENAGVSAARNAAIARATGDVLALLTRTTSGSRTSHGAARGARREHPGLLGLRSSSSWHRPPAAGLVPARRS